MMGTLVTKLGDTFVGHSAVMRMHSKTHFPTHISMCTFKPYIIFQ